VQMAEQRDWELRPCGAGMHKYESLLDGTLDICDVADMNEWLDVKAENEARYYDAMKK
jgi:hypothetical protein